MIRKRFVFNGRVQGVGFRYLTRRAADLIGVTGWVRNERDGSVFARKSVRAFTEQEIPEEIVQVIL